MRMKRHFYAGTTGFLTLYGQYPFVLITFWFVRWRE